MVQNQLLQGIAVLYKRGWLEDNKASTFFEFVSAILRSDSSIELKTIAMKSLYYLVSEFTSTKSSAIGLNWDFHRLSRASFEVCTQREVRFTSMMWGIRKYFPVSEIHFVTVLLSIMLEREINK